MPKALIAMSGGVDSSVAAALMQDGGFDCAGATLKLYSTEDINIEEKRTVKRGCCSLEDVNDARQVAYTLGIPHYTLNFTEAFKKEVIGRFIASYEKGWTPNPCIDCNRYIKFDLLMLRAQQIDFDFLVTGHYARIEQDSDSGRWLLKKARDETKDQSYVLYCLSQDQLARTRFPLGELKKSAVREIAEKRGFFNARKLDSQDICFVPGGDYGAFMEHYTGKHYPEGDIIDLHGKVIGRHRGIVRYTLGQRRGLGVAANEPVYVAAKDMAANTVTLAPDAALYTKSLTARNINLIACEKIERPLRLRVKTRYLQKETEAVVEQTGDDEVRIEFAEKVRAVTPGQAAVFYDGDIVAGGGTIAYTE